MKENNKQNRLGRGLSSIFNKKQEPSNKNISLVDINLIEKNPFQPRLKIADKELKELTKSIKTYGLIQPITVRSKGNCYELVSGERRLRASLLAGLTKIPVFLRQVENNQMREVALVENIQREDLDPIEVALSLNLLINEHQYTQEKLGEKIGKSRSSVSNFLRLLKLDPIIQAGIRDKMISLGHAKAILNVLDKELQLQIYHQIIEQKMSVRETESLVQKKKNISFKSKYKSKIILSNHFQKIQSNLSDFFNEEVSLKIAKNGKGKIEIPFKSEKKLNEIIKLLQS
ncbi:MAG: chromosome partitioning protein ParB [Flavobacteriales bacterium]|nr:chromosome partitioning protein ParB [Flavobacteriales bacterium]|tara:strand:+ start:16412 stop:17272 length:861 start_codon:yes stop_codon:yes gene_type:complete